MAYWLFYSNLFIRWAKILQEIAYSEQLSSIDWRTLFNPNLLHYLIIIPKVTKLSVSTASNVQSLVLYEAASIRVCSSCKKTIAPDEKAVSFKCPNCGTVIIWRCYRCRTMGISYKCPNCGFEGP
uniref:DUF1610 domain-containing protein n=1 Tax=Ignisphaera aggregans TaxID=334771 RepID=A0A7C4BC17_9CREN